MLGARIRCPHCAKLLFVEQEHFEVYGSAAAETPGRAEQGVAAGLPPLSVMLGIREGRVPWADDAELRARMTDEDWAALDAFEAMLRAVAAGRVLLWLGLPVAALTAVFWLVPTERWDGGGLPFGLAMALRLSFLAAVGAGAVLVPIAVQNLRALQVGASLAAGQWGAVGLALGLVANAGLNVVLANGYDPSASAACAFALVPFQAITAVSAVRAALLLRRARALLEAPGVLPRLSDALEHLREAI